MADTTAPITAATTAVEAAPAPVTPAKMMGDTVMFLALMFAVFYFVLIRPQQKKFKAHQSMIKGLEKGDKVIVAGGIIGTVSKFEGDDVVVVEIAQGVQVKVARATVNEALKDNALGTKPALAKAANDK